MNLVDYLLFSYGGEIAVLAVTVVFGCLGWAAKQIYKSLVTDKQKEAIASAAARCVEQVWKTIHGPEKMEKALEYAEALLAKKGIKFDAEEMYILIEAAVAEFNKAFEKADEIAVDSPTEME